MTAHKLDMTACKAVGNCREQPEINYNLVVALERLPLDVTTLGTTATAEQAEENVYLESSTGSKHKVALKSLVKSKVIEGMISSIQLGKEEVIPVAAVGPATVDILIEWLTHYKNVPPAEDECDDEAFIRPSPDEMSPWDENFMMKLNTSEIFSLTNAANYLEITELLTVCCKAIAKLMREKSVEELREMFGIENDFTPEEEEQIRLENSWLIGSQ